MSDTLATMYGIQVLACAPDGEKLQSERDALDLIGEASQQGVSSILVPVERLDDDFFQLKTGLAGHIIQKLVTYSGEFAFFITTFLEWDKLIHCCRMKDV